MKPIYLIVAGIAAFLLMRGRCKECQSGKPADATVVPGAAGELTAIGATYADALAYTAGNVPTVPSLQWGAGGTIGTPAAAVGNYGLTP